MKPADTSVIIPALNEQAFVGDAIRSAWSAGAGEVVLCDGGSQDDTVAVAGRVGVSKIVRSFAGRGLQMNAGARLATRELLLFLHADSRLSSDCLEQISGAGSPDWGAFVQRIDSARQIYRLIERGNAARVRWRSMPFGDQATFICSELFARVGGFPEVPLMEDVMLARKLRRSSRPALLPGPVITSPRRWEARGVIRQTARNWTIQLAYWTGSSPERLANWYR